MRTLVITNPVAGSTKRRHSVRVVHEELRRRGIDEILESRRPGHAGELARARAGDIDRVFVCGGDGTVAEVAAALMDTGVAIGILPGGTTNVLAHECGIPRSPTEALALLLDQHPGTRTFQLWRGGGREFVLGMGVGFDARLMARTSAFAKGRVGKLAVYSGALREWWRYDFPKLHVSGVDEDGNLFELPSTYALACNTRRYAGGFATAPAADPEDEVLDLVLFQGRSRAALWLFWAAMMSTGSLHLGLPYVKQVRACRCTIRSVDGREVEVQVNGDFLGATPVQLEPAGRARFLVGLSR